VTTLSKAPRYRLTIVAAAILAILLFVPHAALLFATLFLAIVFSLLLDAPVSRLAARKVPRPVATIGVVAVAMGTLAALAAWAVPTISSDAKSLSGLHKSFPQTLAFRLNNILAHVPGHLHIKTTQLEFSSLYHDISHYHLLGGLTQAFIAVSAAAIIAIWTVSNPEALESKARLLLPASHRDATSHIAGVVTARLRRWLVGQSIINVYAGVASGILFMLLGVPYWPFFAFLAATLEVIPSFGVLLASAGPAILLLADSPGRLIWLVIGLVVVHQLEDRFIIPHVMGKASDLPQAVVAFAMLAFGLIWGPAGVIMAVPVSATLMAVLIEWRQGTVPSITPHDSTTPPQPDRALASASPVPQSQDSEPVASPSTSECAGSRRTSE